MDNTRMSGPVDVLAAIEAAKPFHCDCGYARCSKNALAAELDRARAAVVELIEAARAYEAARYEGGQSPNSHAAIRFRAALANVGGA